MFVHHAGLKMVSLTLAHRLNVVRVNKRVVLDMTPGSSHVHKARTVMNSKYSHKNLLALSGWSKAHTKQKSESAMTIFNIRDHRTYAQVLLSKHDNPHKGITGHISEQHTTPQGDLSASKQPVVNTVLSTSKVKGSTVNINKQNHPKASRINIKDDARAVDSELFSKPVQKQPLASNMEVSKCYPVTISNRF